MQARFRKRVRRAQQHICGCSNVANRDGTRFRCQQCAAESFAEVSAATNAVSEPVHIAGIAVVRGHCDALNCDVAKIFTVSTAIETKLLARVA